MTYICLVSVSFLFKGGRLSAATSAARIQTQVVQMKSVFYDVSQTDQRLCDCVHQPECPA